LEQTELKRYADEKPAHWGGVGSWQNHWFGKSLPLVDGAATRSEDGRTVTMSLVNRHREASQAVEIDLFDFKPRSGKMVTITGPDPMGYMLKASGKDVSDVDYNPEACTAREISIEPKGSKWTIDIPAHSIVIITVVS
jgi:alpha-L-arabinofuranosidase